MSFRKMTHVPQFLNVLRPSVAYISEKNGDILSAHNNAHGTWK